MELQTQSVLDVPLETCQIKTHFEYIIIGQHAICTESHVTQTVAFPYIGGPGKLCIKSAITLSKQMLNNIPHEKAETQHILIQYTH